VREHQFAEMRPRQEKHNGLAEREAVYKSKKYREMFLSELARELSDRCSLAGLGRKQINLQLLPLSLRSFSSMNSLQQSNLPG